MCIDVGQLWQNALHVGVLFRMNGTQMKATQLGMARTAAIPKSQIEDSSSPQSVACNTPPYWQMVHVHFKTGLLYVKFAPVAITTSIYMELTLENMCWPNQCTDVFINLNSQETL